MSEKEYKQIFNILRVAIVIFWIITLLLFGFPFKINGDSQTYYIIPDEYEWINSPTNTWGYYQSAGSGEVRLSTICPNSTLSSACNMFFVSLTSGNSVKIKKGGTTQTLTLNDSTTKDNVLYYYKNFNYSGSSGNNTFFGYWANNHNVIYNVTSNITNGIYYTFGEGANGPQPVINYADLQVSYYTDIAGSGDNSSYNLDVISWQLWDINGNYLGDDNKVEIRAVPGHFVANDKPSLLQETFNNWVRESNLEVQVFKGSVTLQQKSFSWDYIAGLFSSIKTWGGRFWSIFASDNYWYQYGWIYEIRLLDENDNPLTEWQEIYTGTASKPNNTNTIENSDNLTPELVNTIEDINTENNVTVNWYINNITINMAPEETTDKPWWSYLLDAILELIRTIADLIGNLVDSLLGLFRFTTFEIPDWETKKTTIINNTGYFGQSILFVEDLKTTVQSASYVDPVLTYPGIELDGVELIPEVSVNLNDYVTSLGLTNFRSIAYTCTDGMIYLSLLILVIKKLEELLSK